MTRKYYCDGGLIPPMICVVETYYNEYIAEHYRCLPKTVKSPHEAEYLAILFAVSLTNELDWVQIISDSRHAIFQLSGQWGTGEENHKAYLELIRMELAEKKITLGLMRISRRYNPAGKRLESLKRYYKKNGYIRGWKYYGKKCNIEKI